MSTTSEAEQGAENENMSLNSAKEQVADNEDTPSNSAEKKVTEKQKLPSMSKEDREKMIKQRQVNRVDRLLNRRIPEFRIAVEKYLGECEPARDQMVPASELQFPTAKAEKDHTTRWDTIHKLCEKNNAVLLFIDQFGDDFRAEWKAKKKESVEKRYLFVKEKRKELEKIRDDHEDVMRKMFKNLGIQLPDLENRDQDTTDEEADVRKVEEGAGKEEVETSEEEEEESNEMDVKL